MLPSGKFPRFAIAAALLIALLLVLDLEFVRSVVTSLLASNSLDTAIVFLTSVCCFYAARRSSGYARQLWLLLAIAFSLETLGQAISTYYQSFVPGSAQTPWPSDVLFFVWAAPVFMIFLPLSGEDSSRIDSIRLLDFLQVAILAVTLFLYFFYSPSRWQQNQPALLRQIILVYFSRDLILSLSFLLRSRTSLPSWLRSFFVVLSVVFLLLVLADAEYFLAIVNTRISAGWGDLIWMIPAIIVVFFAVKWQQPDSAASPLSSSRAGSMLNAQILPIAIPLLVIFMGRAIAREQVVLAWLAVAFSVVCSSVRLLLANRRQQRISDNLLNIERALRSSEEILSTAFRNSPDAFSINPFPNGPYLEVNDGFTRLTGHPREETLGKTPRQMNLWVDIASRDEVLAALTADRHIRDFEFRFRTKSGQIRIGQMSASVIPVHDQLCSLVVVRDITQRKEAEDLLRASEERFRSLVENLHVGIIIYDPQVRVLFANQAVQDAFGRRYEQFLGKTVDDLGLGILGEDGAELPPEARPVPRVLATKRPLRSQVIGVRTPSSPQVVWALLDAIPEFNAAGEISRVIVSITDLSEQRRAAEALRESEERFRTLVSDLHVAVVLNQPNGRIEFANAAAYRIFGIPEGTAIGKLPHDLGIVPLTEDGKEIPVDDRPIPWVVRTKAPVENGVLGIRLPGASGKFIWVFGNAAPQFDAHGNVMRVITAFSDITEMKNAERAIHSLSTRLLQLQDDERRRIGRELHDGLAQTVLAINLSLAQVRQSLSSREEAAAVSLERARTLTQQMSREIRTLSYLLHPPLLDDLGLVSTLKEYVHGFSERSGIDTQLVTQIDFERLPQSLEIALFRIVQESLANIQRHSGSTTAQIRLSQLDSRLTLEVIDFGHGMTVPSNGGRQRSRASTTHDPRATGLETRVTALGVGIPGMRERMAQLGGHLDIISGPTGTTVRATITLPLAAQTETADASSSDPHRG